MLSSDVGSLRAALAQSLAPEAARRPRALFEEMNPHLVGDARFEKRWTATRREAAVLVAILERGLSGAGSPSVLLTVRAHDMPSHAGQVSFPGGRIEPDDSGPVDAALREAREETGLAPDRVDVVGALGVHMGGRGFAVTPVVGLVEDPGDLRACPREVAEIFEAPVDFLFDLKNHRAERRAHQGVDYNVCAAPYGDYDIWGLTAGILKSLVETLEEAAEPAL
ncbi:MAG: CoA pyrophosphatase [Parvularculaceae bacterium]